MANTSSGFHTMTIVKKLTKNEAVHLIAEFQNYANTSDFTFIPIHDLKVDDEADEFIKWLHSHSSRYYIGYYPKYKGLLWLLRYSQYSPGFIKPNDVDKPCSIKATINPKILTGEKDYLAAADADYIESVEVIFNNEAKKISSILGEYGQYSMNRPDYCVNFDLSELNIPCTAEQMMYLMKRGNIPTHYDEWEDDSDSAKNSFYLESNSVTINCYWKHKQLKAKFNDCPDLEKSQDLIRFEVQCKYLKTYLMLKDLKSKQSISDSDAIREMLSEDFCREIIRNYFYKIIRRGDYSTLTGAIKIVQSHHFSKKKEVRLINELRRINQMKGIHRVKSRLQGEDLETFRRTLRDLDVINVNPVTIPRDWNIKRVPNLLNAYDRRIEDEHFKKQMEEVNTQILKDYINECKKKR